MDWMRRNALGIAVTYLLAAPVVVTFLSPGEDLTTASIRLLIVWLAGFPLFAVLRRLARSN